MLKFFQYITENNIDELELREYIKEIYNEKIEEIFNNLTDKYSFLTKEVSKLESLEYSNHLNSLIELTVNIVLKNNQEKSSI